MMYKGKGAGCKFVWKGSDFGDRGADWWHNLSSSSVTYGGESVRQGFKEHFELTSIDVLAKITECGEEARFIGHSLGGAVASMAYEYNDDKGYVVTFGAPGPYKSETCDKPGIRYVRDGDPVSSAANNFRLETNKGFDHNCKKRHWYGGCKERKWEEDSLSCTSGGGLDWDFWNSMSKHSMKDSYQAGVSDIW